VQSLMDVEPAVPPPDVVGAGDAVSGPADGVAAVDRMLAELWS
jgi:hypothetical protein